MKNINFLVFHQELSSGGLKRLKELWLCMSKGIRKPGYVEKMVDLIGLNPECLDIFFKTVKLSNPSAGRAVLTDQKSRFSLPSDIKIIRCPVPPDQPAGSRLLAQIDYLARADGSSHSCFLDYDMIVQRDLGPLFENDFDIAFTLRDHSVPINGGVMIVRAGSERKALSFLKKALSIYEELYSEYRLWGGAQRSLSDVAGPVDETYLQRGAEIEGAKVLFLPADSYNFVLSEEETFLDYYPEKAILHFKGLRKKNMITYWKEYVRTRL